MEPAMKHLTPLALSLALASVGTPVLAQTDPHVSHHPAAVAPATAAPAPDPVAGAMDRMLDHMAAMREMHEKVMAVKTPKERNALLAAETKMMQDAMKMLSETTLDAQNGMGCDTSARDKAMDERMQMMQVVMQLMMDRIPPKSVD
jgi:hypothetical protein